MAHCLPTPSSCRSSSSSSRCRATCLLCVFLGAIGSVPLVWALADLSMGVMAIVNLIALIPLSGIAYALFHNYTAQRKQGRDPVFHRGDVPGLRGIQVWGDDDDFAPRTGNTRQTR